MIASEVNPIYTVWLVSSIGKYNVSSVLNSVDMNESKKQIARCATVSIMNVMVDGTWLSDRIKVRDRIFIYANDGNGRKEVFRGFVWNRNYNSSLLDREITLKCYDNLIYLQESEAFEFFASGKSTQDIMSTICSDWGIELEYKYESITHSKLALRGTLSDIMTTDILDPVKDRTGKQYVVLSEKDTLVVTGVGKNSTVHKIEAGKNAISVVSKCTMDGVVTKVVILGRADRQDRRPVEASLSQNTAEYGTLQKIITRDKDTTIEAAKDEGNNILKEKSTPKWEYEVTAIDIPWLRKGDKIYVNAGDLKARHLIVTDLSRSIDNKGKKIILDCIDAET